MNLEVLLGKLILDWIPQSNKQGFVAPNANGFNVTNSQNELVRWLSVKLTSVNVSEGMNATKPNSFGGLVCSEPSMLCSTLWFCSGTIPSKLLHSLAAFWPERWLDKGLILGYLARFMARRFHQQQQKKWNDSAAIPTATCDGQARSCEDSIAHEECQLLLDCFGLLRIA